MNSLPWFTVAGGINTDIVLRTSADPRHDGTSRITGWTQSLGGHAANAAVALARLGSAVRLVGAVGTDADGDAAVASLAREGVDLTAVQRVPHAATGRAVVVNGPRMHHMMLECGANDAIGEVPPGAGPLLVFDPPHRVLRSAIAAAAGRLVVANPGGGIADALPLILMADRRVVLVCNETEFGDIGGPARVAELREQLAALVVTKGAAGCWIADGGGTVTVPAVPAKETDTTAAGDTFTAALAVGLGAGGSLLDAARLAAAAAAVVVENVGGAVSLPGRAALLGALSRRAHPAARDLLGGKAAATSDGQGEHSCV
ncbi:carbohydrate kinase family protein [Streptomyces sp. NPDC058964]|uniref:carbohydrate kinase family protein n=1 Tax=Streptomyces sp. NPDC058964 TaxID=3346681 RepID=UPI00367CA56D